MYTEYSNCYTIIDKEFETKTRLCLQSLSTILCVPSWPFFCYLCFAGQGIIIIIIRVKTTVDKSVSLIVDSIGQDNCPMQYGCDSTVGSTASSSANDEVLQFNKTCL